MGYPGLSAEVFQNANISLLACQLFVMVVSLLTVWYFNAQAKPRAKVANAGAAAAKI